ncbi:MAG: hypothetical protein K2X77_11985 [Candidatus Obscuribacterales bacterium]|jgi:polyhydroxybutyrate depolymerase|nr:hypothetical protein [Candidatus Obscuribacterales bacterium]
MDVLKESRGSASSPSDDHRVALSLDALGRASASRVQSELQPVEIQSVERVAAKGAAPARPPMIAGEHPFKMMSEGKNRDFEVYVPKGYDGRRTLPVVYMLHGYADNIEGIKDSSRMNDLADQKEFAVVYLQAQPKGPQTRQWNLEAGVVAPKEPGFNDLNYFKGVMQEVDSKLNIDPKSRFIVGHSDGGNAAQYIAYRNPGLFAGVGAVNSTRFITDPPPTLNSKTAAVILLAGDDRVLPPAGGSDLQLMMLQPRLWHSRPQEQKNFWAKVNQCSGPPRVQDDGHKLVTHYSNCKGAAVTEIHRYTAEHGWNQTPQRDTTYDVINTLMLNRRP